MFDPRNKSFLSDEETIEIVEALEEVDYVDMSSEVLYDFDSDL